MVTSSRRDSAPPFANRDTAERCLARITDTDGEGGRVFTRVYVESARAVAEAIERKTALNIDCGPLAGMPVSIKDLFDVSGETTLAGSRALLDAPPAKEDAEVVRRLRRAGAVIVGKSNMTEFAFSGLGINPHYGTPANPWRRDERRVPGGSSSGAAVSVADGMAIAAIGTDTGGSVRIPAAMCGLVGFKPTAKTVPLRGTLPLSWSYDSIGPIAKDVNTCVEVYAAVADATPLSVSNLPASSISLGVAQNYCLDGTDSTVARTFENALNRLSAAGVRLNDYVFPAFDRLPSVLVEGGLVAAEAYAWHRSNIERQHDLYDPRVLSRIMRGSGRSFADYWSLANLRNELVEAGSQQLRRVSAVVMPTVPVIPPRIAELDDEAEYTRVNLLVLRNPTIANILDACSISLPCHEPGEAPVGLMLIAPGGSDGLLLSIALSLEEILQTSFSKQ